MGGKTWARHDVLKNISYRRIFGLHFLKILWQKKTKHATYKGWKDTKTKKKSRETNCRRKKNPQRKIKKEQRKSKKKTKKITKQFFVTKKMYFFSKREMVLAKKKNKKENGCKDLLK